MRQWRLIYDNPAVGARNMAVDEAILESVGAGLQPPTLRLYAWHPPCLSLGYGQRASDVDFARCQELGWDVVRRPTGGRAILHTDELTYSLALTTDDDLAAGSVVDSYRRISAALVRGLSYLGVYTEAEAKNKPVATAAVCFETPSDYEITIAGRKLVGSAQVRRKGGVLQHGTLPLTGDIARICEGLIFPHQDAKQRVRQQAITLSDALGRTVSWDQVAAAMVDGFRDIFDVDFGNGTNALTGSETICAELLNANKYATAEWTRRR